MENKKSSDDNKNADNNKPTDGKKRSARSIIILVLILLLLLLLLLRVTGVLSRLFGPRVPVAGVDADTAVVDTAVGDTVGVTDTMFVDTAAVDTIPPVDEDSLALARARADSLARLRRAAAADSRARADSLARIEDSLARLRAIEDSLARLRAMEDSLRRVRDSLARLKAIDDSLRARADSLARIVDPCARDTLQPWVYADPSGGLHRKAVSVKLVANKECRIEWRLEGSDSWRVYDGTPVSISEATTLHYRAEDGCGKKMAARSKRYSFDFTDRSSQCPRDMEFIKVGNREFCVDIYEWPNRRGVQPNAFVSLYQAMDSCFSVRKRLCTSDEWTTACAGPENWAYTYGGGYEGNTCAARDTLPLRSGSRPECRGYFGVFDMSGNLAEWTSTPSPHDRSFNNVMGGFWASGTQSRCADARYSYFPQNRHNPVGFRCCADVGSEQPQRRGR